MKKHTLFISALCLTSYLIYQNYNSQYQKKGANNKSIEAKQSKEVEPLNNPSLRTEAKLPGPLLDGDYFTSATEGKPNNIKIGDRKIKLIINVFEPPIKVFAGQVLDKEVAPWAEAFSHRNPIVAKNYETWLSNVSPEWAEIIAKSAADFQNLKNKAAVQEECTLIYSVFAEENQQRLLYLVDEVQLPGTTGVARGVQIFKWLSNRWVAHSNDDFSITGKMQLSDLKSLSERINLFLAEPK
jgi:hypothetical protein